MYDEVSSPNFDEIVRDHALLVKRIAHHLRGRLPDSVQLDDLIQAGMIEIGRASCRERV